jgi:hypothetical protein
MLLRLVWPAADVPNDRYHVGPKLRRLRPVGYAHALDGKPVGSGVLSRAEIASRSCSATAARGFMAVNHP